MAMDKDSWCREAYDRGFKEGRDFEKEKLTKAIELLKWALHSDPEHDEDFDQKWEEAEQFLKETK